MPDLLGAQHVVGFGGQRQAHHHRVGALERFGETLPPHGLGNAVAGLAFARHRDHAHAEDLGLLRHRPADGALPHHHQGGAVEGPDLGRDLVANPFSFDPRLLDLAGAAEQAEKKVHRMLGDDRPVDAADIGHRYAVRQSVLDRLIYARGRELYPTQLLADIGHDLGDFGGIEPVGDHQDLGAGKGGRHFLGRAHLFEGDIGKVLHQAPQAGKANRQHEHDFHRALTP